MGSYRSWRDTIDRKPGCRIPRRGSFTPDLLRRLLAHTGCANGAELSQHFDMDSVAGVRLQAPAGYQATDYSRYYEGRDVPDDFKISPDGVGRVSAGYYHFFGFVSPLQFAESADDIAAYPLPDYSQWSAEGMAERVEELHRQGHFVCGQIGHTYETAWQIRGYEEFLEDLMLRPDMAELLLERLTLRNCANARETAKAGADYLMLGDDVASQNALMFPPTIWRRVFKPRLARIIAAGRAEKPGIDAWYHSDGNITEIIPDLIEVGITILNPLQPECLDPFAVFDTYGDQLVLDGTVGTQTVMPFGTPAEVDETVARTIEHCGQEGGIILAPTHVLEPEVPIENIEALFAACSKYGNGRL